MAPISINPGPKGFTKQKRWVPARYREEKVKNIGGYFGIPLFQMAGSLLSYVKLPTNDFFSYQNFGEIEQKISKIYQICTGIRKTSKNFPISLSKNSKTSPEKKNTATYNCTRKNCAGFFLVEKTCTPLSMGGWVVLLVDIWTNI
jgi:hypothetical protein